MVNEVEESQINQAVRSLVKTSNNAEMIAIRVDSEVTDHEERIRKLEYLTQINFLHGTDKITGMEYKAIMDMFASPDGENHFMARKIVETKILESNYHMVTMNI